MWTFEDDQKCSLWIVISIRHASCITDGVHLFVILIFCVFHSFNIGHDV